MKKERDSGEKDKIKKKEKRIVISMGALLISSILMQTAARKIDGFGEWYAMTVYPVLRRAVGGFLGLFPFSCVEILLYLLLAGSAAYGIRHVEEWKKLLSRTGLLLSILFFLYTVNCGVNYYRNPFSQFLGYGVEKRAARDLEALLEHLTRQVNRTNGGRLPEKLSTGEMAVEGVKSMEKLGSEYPVLDGFYPRPKKLCFSRILSVQQLSGIYSPFTIEANYNGEMPTYNVPHTICHELSHLQGFMREDEANFIGFLACIGSEHTEFQYSGYLMAWIYTGNALAEEDPERYYEYWDKLNETTKEELRENSIFWERFDTKVAAAAETINDTYLRANSQTEGVKSYGRVVDLLLAWYMQ